jgi:hypothetical protein
VRRRARRRCIAPVGAKSTVVCSSFLAGHHEIKALCDGTLQSSTTAKSNLPGCVGRINRGAARGVRQPTAGIRGEHGKSCCGGAESWWNAALRTSMRRGHTARALAGLRKYSQARADSPGQIQSFAGDPAIAGQGHAAPSAGALGGRSDDFIAVLDSSSGSHRTGMRIGSDAPVPSHAMRMGSFFRRFSGNSVKVLTQKT